MNNINSLKRFLNIFGIISLILFVGLFLLTAIDSPLMLDGGALRFMRWEPLAKHIELMLETVYIVWGVFLLRAAKDPNRFASFIDFTIWANLAHGLLMVVQTLLMPMFLYKLGTDVAYCLILAIGLTLLRPKGLTESVRVSV